RVSCLPVLDDDARLAGIVSERDIFKSLVSITGIHQPGVQLAFELPNQRGELRQLISLVVAHDMRLVSVLSILKDNVRIVSIRCRGASEQAEDAMIEDMKAQGLLYWVRGGKTHLV
ncbi:MAG: CBS domain-containing protein, partial [Desulfovibrio sp.]|nr:CBS domain-containing protein [Desulfovibrio sp.]